MLDTKIFIAKNVEQLYDLFKMAMEDATIDDTAYNDFIEDRPINFKYIGKNLGEDAGKDVYIALYKWLKRYRTGTVFEYHIAVFNVYEEYNKIHICYDFIGNDKRTIYGDRLCIKNEEESKEVFKKIRNSKGLNIR